MTLENTQTAPTFLESVSRFGWWLFFTTMFGILSFQIFPTAGQAVSATVAIMLMVSAPPSLTGIFHRRGPLVTAIYFLGFALGFAVNIYAAAAPLFGS